MLVRRLDHAAALISAVAGVHSHVQSYDILFYAEILNHEAF